MRQGKVFIYALFFVLFVICGYFLIGCTEEPVPDAAAEPEEIVSAVLKQMLTAPDAEAGELIRAARFFVIGLGVENDDDAVKAQEAAEAELTQLLQTQYAQYFTDEGLTEFIEGDYSGLGYYLTLPVMYEQIPQTSLTSFVLTEVGTETPGAYRFDATISCELDGEREEAEIVGYAYFAEEGEMTRFTMDDDSALLECLMRMSKK